MKKSVVVTLSILFVTLLFSLAVSAKTKIVVWQAVGVLDGLIADFHKANPDIEAELIKPGDFYSKVPVAAAAGSLPDVCMVGGPSVPLWYQWLLPLDNYIDQSIVQDWMPVSRDEMYWQGKLWAVPVESNSQALAYNEDTFFLNGIAVPSKSWTWDDLLKIGSKLTIDKNGDGQMDQWGFYGYVGGSVGFATWLYLPWIQQTGADVFDPAGKVILNQPGTTKALKFMRDLYGVYRTQPVRNVEPSWTSGAIAMAYRPATNLRNDLVKFPNLNLRAVIFPKPEDGAYVSGSGGWAIGVTRQTKNIEASMKFIQYFASQEAVAYLATKADLPPIAFRQTVMQKIMQGRVEISPGMERFPYEAYSDAIMHGRARTRTPYWPEIEKILGPMLQQAFIGKDPVSALVTSATGQLIELVKE